MCCTLMKISTGVSILWFRSSSRLVRDKRVGWMPRIQEVDRLRWENRFPELVTSPLRSKIKIESPRGMLLHKYNTRPGLNKRYWYECRHSASESFDKFCPELSRKSSVILPPRYNKNPYCSIIFLCFRLMFPISCSRKRLVNHPKLFNSFEQKGQWYLFFSSMDDVGHGLFRFEVLIIRWTRWLERSADHSFCWSLDELVKRCDSGTAKTGVRLGEI